MFVSRVRAFDFVRPVVAASCSLLLALTWSGDAIAQSTNYAVLFDGFNDRVNLSSMPLGEPTSVTVEAWVRLDGADKFQFLVTNAASDFNDGFSLYVDPANRATFLVLQNNSSFASVASTTTLEVGVWYHVAGVYDHENGFVKLFLDGVEEASIAYGGGIRYFSGRDLRFGSQKKGHKQLERTLNGALDEVRIWNVALDGTTIEANRGHELDLPAAGLIGYWPMNEGQGLTTADQSGADNTGNLEQGATWTESDWEFEEEVYEVAIDIRPHSKKNVLRMHYNRRKISVAILSDADFDAPAVVDRASLTFGRTGDEESLHWRGKSGKPRCHARDVNHDGQKDLVCRFKLHEAGFQEGDTEGFLKGQTVDGHAFMGSDAVTIKVKKKHHRRRRGRRDT